MSAPLSDPAPLVVAPAPSAPPASTPGALTWVIAAIAAGGLLTAGLLWQKVGSMQEQLARQSADSGKDAVEARTLARQAQEQARDVTAKYAALDGKVQDLVAQRAQVEALLQNASRTKDESLLTDLDASLRLAEQQAQSSGRIEPLLAALKVAEQRVAQNPQPRWAALQKALKADRERLQSANAGDAGAVLDRIDQLLAQVDEWPLATDLPTQRDSVAKTKVPAAVQHDLGAWTQRVWDALAGLVRVSRVDPGQSAVLAPEQGFYLRENVKLRLLNVRMAVLARQLGAARTDMTAVSDALKTHFDPASRKVQSAAGVVQEAQAQLRSIEQPSVQASLAALAQASSAASVAPPVTPPITPPVAPSANTVAAPR